MLGAIIHRPRVICVLGYAMAMITALAAGARSQAAVLYFTNGTPAVYQISESGVVSQFVSPSSPGAAYLSDPNDLSFDTSGNLYVVNGNSQYIAKYAPDGSATPFYSGFVGGVKGLAVNTAGNVYVTQYIYNSLTIFSPDGTPTNYITGLNHPLSVAADSSGTAYVVNSGDSSIAKITSAGAVSTLAAGLDRPGGLAVDRTGNLYVSSIGGNDVLRINPDGSTNIYASGLNEPTFLTFDTVGDLFVYNAGNTTLLKVTPLGVVTTVAASGLYGLSGLATPIPEPSAIWCLVSIGLFALITRMRSVKTRAN